MMRLSGKEWGELYAFIDADASRYQHSETDSIPYGNAAYAKLQDAPGNLTLDEYKDIARRAIQAAYHGEWEARKETGKYERPDIIIPENYPDRERRIIELKSHGWTHREIAQVLKVSEKTVQRLWRGLFDVRKHLNSIVGGNDETR